MLYLSLLNFNGLWLTKCCPDFIINEWMYMYIHVYMCVYIYIGVRVKTANIKEIKILRFLENILKMLHKTLNFDNEDNTTMILFKWLNKISESDQRCITTILSSHWYRYSGSYFFLWGVGKRGLLHIFLSFYLAMLCFVYILSWFHFFLFTFKQLELDTTEHNVIL